MIWSLRRWKEGLKRFGLDEFMELDKAGMDGIGMEWIGVLGPKVFPAEAAEKGSNIISQAEVIKMDFCGERETLGENRGLEDDEMLRGEVNKRVGRGVRTVVSVGRKG